MFLNNSNIDANHMLLWLGIHFYNSNKWNKNALIYATKRENIEIIKLLLGNPKIDINYLYNLEFIVNNQIFFYY